MADAIVTKNWRDLIKPRGLVVDQESLTNTYGKFVAEPLERGFGITLGNSLRRVLLSSLQGAAITSVKIEGVEHEFMAIPEVAEDVTDIILNLKEVLLQIHSNEPKTIRIEAEGPREIKAGDIVADGQVEVLNPGHHVLTLSEGGRVRMEMTARRGRGYVPAERNKVPGQPIGTIPIDALFSPIRKVNYQVTNARVGQQTDFDKLTLEVWTDGSVAPADAVAFAAKIMKEQLSIFINFDETEEPAIEIADGPGAGAQREPVPLGRRARALRPQRQLPPERQHQDHRRPGAEDRGGDAEDQELRPEVAEGDQGDPRRDGALPRHEARELAPQDRAAGPQGLGVHTNSPREMPR